AADTGGYVRLRCRAVQAFRKRHDDPVAACMPETVVERLEVVEVAQNHGGGHADLPAMGEGTFSLLLETAPVEKRGKGVRHRVHSQIVHQVSDDRSDQGTGKRWGRKCRREIRYQPGEGMKIVGAV